MILECRITVCSSIRAPNTVFGEFESIGTDTIRKKFSTYCMGVTFDHQCVGGDFIFVCSNVSSLCTFYIDFLGGLLLFYIFNNSTVPA